MSNADFRTFSPIFVAILCFLFTAGPARAQEQGKDQQACINKMNKAFAKVAKAQSKEALSCIKSFQKGKLGGQTIEACLVADAKGKVSEASAQTIAAQVKSCSGEPPDFAFTSAANVNQQAVDAAIDWIHGMFGDNLDAVVRTSTDDKDAAKCQEAVAKIAAKCFDAYLKEFNKCKKDALKGKGAPPADSVDDIQACDGADPKSKISKTCTGKMASTELKKCAGQTISTLFTGCPGNLAACTSGEVETRASEAVTLADNLYGVPASCGDGVLDTGEECDDGCLAGVPNVCEPVDDGDGCDSNCALTPEALYFTGTGFLAGQTPTIWTGDTGGTAPPTALYSGADAAPDVRGPVGIVESEGELFWGTGNSWEVFRGNADGSGATSALANGGDAASARERHDVAVDRANDRYFFTAGLDGLFVANLDGSGTATNVAVPHAGSLVISAVYDAGNDLLYFGQLDRATGDGVISRVQPDGTELVDLYTDIDWVRDLAIDFVNELIFYVDLDVVGVVPLDGIGAPITVFDPDGLVRGIDFDPTSGDLFWVSFDPAVATSDLVQRGSADGTGAIETLYAGDFDSLRGIAVGGARGTCGDGIIDPLEECDDGNTFDGDGCSADCTIEIQPACGDGNLDPGEECDDGNTFDGDGCSADCTIEIQPACGDGNLDPGEECDDGNTFDGDGCSADCTIEIQPACGDGNLDPGEECDDGNTFDGDGCSADCMIEIQPACGDGDIDPGEECDDGNADPDDGCHDCSITHSEGVTQLNGILFFHNLVRRNVDNPPPAVPLDLFTWDINLQTVAQNYADQCIWAHNANRNAEYAALVGGSPTVGENLFLSSFSSISAEDPVNQWASEEADYDYATNTCRPGAACGHYTQIVWDTTTSVGCGYRFCATVVGLGPEWDNSHLVVCNYNPAGNWIGERPYDD